MIPEELRKQIKLTKSAANTERADLFGAFDNRERLTFTLTMPRQVGGSSPYMEMYRDNDRYFYTLPFVKIEEEENGDEGFDRFTLSFDTAELCREGGKDYTEGLFYYTVIFESAFARHRISRRRDSYKPCITYADYGHSAFQLTVYDKVYSPCRKFCGGTMYHIFVDRFCKGGDYPVRSDAELNPDWENGLPQYASQRGGFVKNNMFFGGTLTGIESKLDYLKELSVSIIYLSPIFEAYSNHKYDTGRYDRVDSMFGSDEALESLIKAARERGISVILDMVFNHTGSDSMYFNKNGRYDTLGAYQSRESEFFEWFDFESFPDKYRCWWGVDILPAVNTENQKYNEYINGEGGIVEKYLKMGIDGYRLDVADELSPKFLENLTHRVKTVDPDALIIGEVWEDASCKEAYGQRRRYFRGRQLDSVMNYPLKNGIINFVKYGDKASLFEASVMLYQNYPKFVSDSLMNFLGTHDTERVLTVLGTQGEQGMSADELARYRMNPEQRERAIEKLRLAYVILAFMPGIPCTYYGDEAGMEGFRDPFNRMPYPWGRQEARLVEHYKKIGRIRSSHSVLADGYFEVDEDTPYGVFVFTRYNADEKITVAVNCSEGECTVRGGSGLLDSQGATLLEGDNLYSIASGGYLITCEKMSKCEHKM